MISENILINRREVVRIHLDILDSLLAEPLTAAQAIRASMSLRFLLDGALNKVAHQEEVNLLISAPDTSTAPINQALLFSCGGYTIGQHEITPYYMYREPDHKSPHRAQFEREIERSPRQHTFAISKLGVFQQLPCLALMGNKFTREAVVRYVANKCGGAHHHDNTSKFDLIDHYLTSVGHMLKINDAELSVVFLETLGTAWFLMNSPSIATLRARIAG
ncbi:hypothetical protein [Pseudomonas grimontii]|uniref:hypothetical protein n=1 Tax=Pseudomonas grimontii TaxID=129847 RepID=UPI00387B3B26